MMTWRRDLKALAQVLRSNFGRLRSPYKLTFAPTYRCNLRCRICSIWRKAPGPELTPDELRRLFRSSGAFSWVAITGGEPALRDDLPLVARCIIEGCKDLCVLSIATNGYETDRTLATVRDIAALRPPRLFVAIGIDGPPDVHNRQRGRPDAWRRSMDTFIGLQRLSGVETLLSMTLCDGNLRLIDKTVEAIRDACPGFDVKRSLNFNVFHRSPHYYGNCDAAPPDAGKLREDILDAKRILEQPTLKGFLQYAYLDYCLDYQRTRESPLPCQALSSSLFLDAAGVVYPCVAYDRPLGQVRDYGYDLDRMWNEAHVRQAYRDCRAGACPRCWSPCDAYQSINGALHRSVRRFLGSRQPTLAADDYGSTACSNEPPMAL